MLSLGCWARMQYPLRYKSKTMPLQPKPGPLKIEPYKGGASKAKGAKPVAKLSSNENPLGPSPRAVEAYKGAANQLFRYPDPSATELRDAIGEVYDLNPERIICGAGSDEIISLLCKAYAGPGDEVIYTQYGFLMYPISTLAAGATPVVAPENNLTTDVNQILGKVTERTKIVFIANPNNPTGSYIPHDEVVRLRKNLPENVLLVLDGAYAEYVSNPDYTAGADIVDMGDNTVMTRTFSKIYGLSSLRLGWAYCPESVVDIYNRVRGPFNVSSPAIAAGIAAVKDVQYTQKVKAHNDIWLAWLSEEVAKLGLQVTPSVGNFILAHFAQGEKNAAAAYDFLLQQDIIARPMASYGLPQALRFSIGLEEENKRLVEALAIFLG